MKTRRIKDDLARFLFCGAAGICCLTLILIMVLLLAKAWPMLEHYPLSTLLFSSKWQPLQGEFGMFSFIAGTVAVSLLSMAIAVPPSLLAAVYLAEYAPPRFTPCLESLVDLLSGIPSVIYGVWGIMVIVPAVEQLAGWCGFYSSGYSLLAGALVLALMVCPFIVHLSREVLASVPWEMREASLCLGATRWQTVKHVVLRKAFPGIAAAVMLGLSRALGETIAVVMVVGNIPIIPRSLFDPVYPLPALLANTYGEMMSVPRYDAALLFAALVLLFVVLVFNTFSRLALGRITAPMVAR